MALYTHRRIPPAMVASADQLEATAKTARAANTARAQAEHAREWEGRRQEVRLTPTLTLPLT